jgi:hypothetical protein
VSRAALKPSECYRVTLFIVSVRTSQKTHRISVKKMSPLIFGETGAVYCERQTEHKYSLWEKWVIECCIKWYT